MASMVPTAKKLVKALNSKGYTVLMGNKQFIGFDGRIVNYWTVYQAVYDEERRRYVNEDLYGSARILFIVFYLRDLWYMVNDMPLPTDHNGWNVIRKTIQMNAETKNRLLENRKRGFEDG